MKPLPLLAPFPSAAELLPLPWLHLALRFAGLLAVGVTAGILLVTLYPFDFQWSYGTYLGPWAEFRNPWWDVLINVPFFAPVGGAWALVHARRGTRPERGLVWAQLYGTTLSAGIEVAQIFTPRGPTVVDVVTNSFGTCLGYLAVYALLRHLRRKPVGSA